MNDASRKYPADGAAPPTCISAPAVLRRRSMVLITGGSGFVGANLADRLAAAGERVLIYDNLSRPNVMQNLEWLQRRHGHRIETAIADVRDADALRDTVRLASAVFHLAAQVALTSSLDDPLGDFEINARGTLNVLEAARRRPEPPPLVFASTSKVYGEPFEAARLLEDEHRYLPPDGLSRAVGETCPLGPRSPYGCSKGAADQYVLDYAQAFRLRAVVFRMSCLYGPRQFGTEDQGWVAHFLIRALRGQPITIFGDGKQVRDLLYVDDAVDACLRARARIASLAGHAFNLGGGPHNTASPLELLARFAGLGIAPPPVRFAGWRPGDQRYYVSDTSKLERLAGWRARTGVAEGLRRLQRWLVASGIGRGEPAAGIEPEMPPEMPPEMQKVPA
ncbi:MAG: NAD-dependent epimerase/dehydratase family protein [Geminicoccaceae bacterium]